MSEPVTIDLSGGRKLTIQASGVKGRVLLSDDYVQSDHGWFGTVDLAELYAALRVATGTTTHAAQPEALLPLPEDHAERNRRFLAGETPTRLWCE